MATTGPTTRPSLSFHKPCACTLDSSASCLRFLRILNPTDPLVTRKWRDFFPHLKRFRGRYESVVQIYRHAMHNTGSDFFLGHSDASSLRRFYLDSPTRHAQLYPGALLSQRAFSSSCSANNIRTQKRRHSQQSRQTRERQLT